MPQSHTEHAPEWYHHSVSSFCLSEVFFSCSTSDWSATISLRDSYFMWRCITVGVSTEPFGVTVDMCVPPHNWLPSFVMTLWKGHHFTVAKGRKIVLCLSILQLSTLERTNQLTFLNTVMKYYSQLGTLASALVLTSHIYNYYKTQACLALWGCFMKRALTLCRFGTLLTCVFLLMEHYSQQKTLASALHLHLSYTFGFHEDPSHLVLALRCND